MRSGHATDEDLRRTQAAAFDSHLVKPVGTETLLAAIERATRGSRAVNAS